MAETTQDKPLAEKTVKELREMAKELPGATGIHAMKKDELLALLAGGAAATGETPPTAKAAAKGKSKGATRKAGGKKVKEMTRVELKAKLKELRQGQGDAQAAGKKEAAVLRRRINRLKKQSRRREAAV